MPFRPNDQLALLEGGFDPLSQLRQSLTKKAPWSSIIEFATSEGYCGQGLYPRQQTLLRLIYLETENMTDYDLKVINEWRRGFNDRIVCGVQPDIWHRVEYLKRRGYRRFPHIQAVLGRRASKGFIGAILGAEQIAYLIAMDNPQRNFNIREGKSVFLNVGATSQTQAQRQLFADIREVVQDCVWLQPYLAEMKDHQMRLRTPADVRRLARLKAQGVNVETLIASLWAVPLSASSVVGRGATSYCLDPETPVLTADLRWVPIKSVMPGDAVVGIDEFPERAQGSERNGQRKLRRATVLAKAFTTKKAYRLTFDNGRSVTCSADHRWLVRRSSGPLDWRVTKGPTEFHSLKVGHQIVQAVEPWEEDDSREAGYLSGVYDGEGSLNRGGKRGLGACGLSVCFTQNPGLVLDRTLDLLKEKGFSPQPSNSHAYLHDGKCEQWVIRGLAESLRFLGQMRPERLVARASAAFEGVSLLGEGSSRYTQPPKVATIVKIEELPEQLLVDIQTSTKTFLANGLVSHNCNMFDEFAFHVQGTGSVKSGDEIYEDWQPSLGQFKKDALTYVPSSPFTKTGKFYELYNQGRVLMHSYEEEAGVVSQEARSAIAASRMLADLDEVELEADPTMLIIQGPSWMLYEDFELGGELTGFQAEFAPENDLRDEEQQRRRKKNPEKFAVERLGQFAEVLGQYLDSSKVDAMFRPVEWRDPALCSHCDENGVVLRGRMAGQLCLHPLSPSPFGRFDHIYRIHVDPSSVDANFALAIGHTEPAPPDQHGQIWPHVIIDRLKVWQASDFPENPETGKCEIDQTQVEREISELLYAFPSTSIFSSDQWNSVGFLQRLRKKYAPGIRVIEVTATEKVNWERAEKFKAALNLGWVHSYADNFFNDGKESLLENECKFLSEKNGKVYKQEFGPVQTKDLYDAVSTVAVDLLSEALERWDSGTMTASAHGSTNVAAIRSGRDQERAMVLGTGASAYRNGTNQGGIYRDGHRQEATETKAWEKLDEILPSRHRRSPYAPTRVRSPGAGGRQQRRY